MTERNPYDLDANEDSERRKVEKDERARRTNLDDMKWLMGGPRGRRIMYGILEQAGIWRTSFTGNSETFYREGMRNIGLMLLSRITDACPDEYINMVREAKDNDRGS